MTNVAMIIPQITFLLKIVSISNLTNFMSPEVMVHGVPWQIGINKDTNGVEQQMSIFLHCAIKDNSSDWSYTAVATFKLMPLSGNKGGIVRYSSPYVFDSTGIGFGFPSFIKWNELFKAENNYVKDDTITLDIKIEAADPQNPSRLLFETIETSCDEGCLSKYRLNVINIDSLMAVKSPHFTMRNSPWVFMVFKSNAHLGVLLQNRAPTTEISRKVEISLKIVSSKNNVQSIEPAAQHKIFKNYGVLIFENIISWNELLKPANGFTNHNSIVIEVEIKANKPEVVIDNHVANNRNKPERKKLSCAICMEAFNNQEVSSTQCGHLFCSSCIKRSLQARQKCPSCNADVTLNSLHRVYL